MEQLIERSPEQCFKDYLQKENGLRVLIEGSTNYYLEAVLMSLINIESYAEYFIREKYTSSKKLKNVCPYLNWLIIGVSQPYLEQLNKNKDANTVNV